MFLRHTTRRKNGKLHRYFSVVENRRIGQGQSTQRQVMYLGEINDSAQAAWRKTLKVFDEDRGQYCSLSLFPDDRVLPADAADAVSVKLTEMQLRRPRSFGNCWLACLIWDELQLSQFWKQRLHDPRAGVAWEKVLQLLAVNRLIDPGSEFRVHRQWFLGSAMDELLGVDFAAAGKDRLYRCLDRLTKHKDELFQFLQQRWKTLFDARFDVLLYDLTSTYFEGLCEQIPKAKHGYSRDGRPDCRQVVVALVVTTDGLPLAYEVMPGNTSDKTTLKAFLEKIHKLYGKARRVWLMDRGIPTEALLQEMRTEGVLYLVGTPRSLMSKMEKDLADKPWSVVRESVSVKLLEKDGELYVLALSEDRQKKENAMRRRKLKNLIRGLNALRRRLPDRDTLLGKVAVLRSEAGRAGYLITVHLPAAGEPVTRQTFTYTFDIEKFRHAMTWDGHYLLRTNIPMQEQAGPQANQSDPASGAERPATTSSQDTPASRSAAELWEMYMQLVRVEEAFRTLKSDLGIRPIYHYIEPRVEAHILVAFLGYCLSVSLRMKLSKHAPGLSSRAVLEQLATIQMVDVCLPTTDGRWLVMPRYTEPEPDQAALLEKLQLALPGQPPPRIRSGKLLLPEEHRKESVVKTS